MTQAGRKRGPTSSKVGKIRGRYSRILRFASANLAVTWWYEILLPKIGLAKIAKRTREKRMTLIAKRFYALAIDLGGLMIKVGQYMSSRLDVLPPEITSELEGLQDEVPAAPFALVRALAESEFGKPLEEVFASIEQTPLAAASLGQTHRAVLHQLDSDDTGLTTVVVKVQRPHIDQIIAIDLAALRKVSRWVSKIKVVSKRVDAPALVEEFADTSLEEIDYQHEARNLERFHECFENDDRVQVPQVVWERSTKRVLTLEDVTAIKINDVQAIRKAGINPDEVALVFAEIMFDQLFNYGFFHADPHPGNVFITPIQGPGNPWKLTFIDFGMMGEVPENTQQDLRKFMIAAASRDGKGLVSSIAELGVLLPNTDTNELERAVTELFSRFGGMGFVELREVDTREFHDFFAEFGEMVRMLPFQFPENFLLILRSISLTFGVCSTLNPRFNMWNSIEPYATQMLRDESGNIVKEFAQNASDLVGNIIRLPNRFEEFISRMENGTLEIATPKIEHRIRRIERTTHRQLSGIIFGGILVAGAVIRADDVMTGTIVMAASAIPLLHALFARR